MLQIAVTSIESSHSVTAQLGEAGVLMGVGMLSVFLFLSLLIFAMFLLAWLVKQFPGEEVVSTNAQPVTSTSTVKNDKPTPQVVAAISVAIDRYRRQK